MNNCQSMPPYLGSATNNDASDIGWRLREIREIMVHTNDFEQVKVIDKLLEKVDAICKKRRLSDAYTELGHIQKRLSILE